MSIINSLFLPQPMPPAGGPPNSDDPEKPNEPNQSVDPNAPASSEEQRPWSAEDESLLQRLNARVLAQAHATPTSETARHGISGARWSDHDLSSVAAWAFDVSTVDDLSEFDTSTYNGCILAFMTVEDALEELTPSSENFIPLALKAFELIDKAVRLGANPNELNSFIDGWLKMPRESGEEIDIAQERDRAIRSFNQDLQDTLNDRQRAYERVRKAYIETYQMNDNDVSVLHDLARFEARARYGELDVLGPLEIPGETRLAELNPSPVEGLAEDVNYEQIQLTERVKFFLEKLYLMDDTQIADKASDIIRELDLLRAQGVEKPVLITYEIFTRKTRLIEDFQQKDPKSSEAAERDSARLIADLGRLITIAQGEDSQLKERALEALKNVMEEQNKVSPPKGAVESSAEDVVERAMDLLKHLEENAPSVTLQSDSDEYVPGLRDIAVAELRRVEPNIIIREDERLDNIIQLRAFVLHWLLSDNTINTKQLQLLARRMEAFFQVNPTMSPQTQAMLVISLLQENHRNTMLDGNSANVGEVLRRVVEERAQQVPDELTRRRNQAEKRKHEEEKRGPKGKGRK